MKNAASVPKRMARWVYKNSGLPRARRAIEENAVRRAIVSGRISFREAQALTKLIKTLNSEGPIVEIGTLFGFSTLIMAIAKDPSRRLITVDKFVWNPVGLTPEAHLEITSDALSEAIAHLNVELIVQDKDDFYSSYQGPPPALMFLDADHEYEPTLKDIKASIAIGADVICGHDYGPQWPGVMKAVDDCGGLLQLDGTFWVLNRDRARQ